ncbi:hypothetical protein GCM10010271_74080 [Streptomyces kurssanovii]|nr:hypothetical protein GCM10010271_74080 [Streptomyces kurssanovii]
MTTNTRCQAAHATDTSPCEGARQAVRLRDGKGNVKLGCVHHAARAIASIGGLTVAAGPHGYQGYAWGDSASRTAIRRAKDLAPFDWQQQIA